MDKNDLTIGQAKELSNIFGGNNNNQTDNFGGFIGQKVIIRTYSAGVHYGTLIAKSGNEVILENSRRLYQFWCKQGISLSGVAQNGVIAKKSKITNEVNKIWLEAIEIIPCSNEAIKSIEECKYVEAE